MELYPSEFEVRVVEVEKEIDWLRYEHETGEVRGKALNRAYEMAMRLWDVDQELSQKYVRILNNISNESLGRRLSRTPHYGYFRWLVALLKFIYARPVGNDSRLGEERCFA